MERSTDVYRNSPLVAERSRAVDSAADRKRGRREWHPGPAMVRRVLLPGILALGWACGGATEINNSNATDPFAGTWSCTVTETRTFTVPPGTSPATHSGSSTVSIASMGDGTITWSTIVDGGTSCALKYGVSGTTATLLQGQSCTQEQGDLTQTGVFTSGTVTVSAQTLSGTMSFEWTQILGSVDAGQPTFAGAGTITHSCTRI